MRHYVGLGVFGTELRKESFHRSNVAKRATRTCAARKARAVELVRSDVLHLARGRSGRFRRRWRRMLLSRRQPEDDVGGKTKVRAK
jgi:hypothetical protein